MTYLSKHVNKRGMCQNPLFNKITPVTDICDRGDFHIFGVLAHPFFVF